MISNGILRLTAVALQSYVMCSIVLVFSEKYNDVLVDKNLFE